MASTRIHDTIRRSLRRLRITSAESQDSAPSNAGQVTPEPGRPACDPTPTSIPEIEGCINFHRSQLDILGPRLRDLHEQIERDRVVLARLRKSGEMPAAASMMLVQIQVQEDARWGLKQIAQWHLDEIVRLEEAWMGLRRERPEERAASGR